jgi:hypothetical protein
MDYQVYPVEKKVCLDLIEKSHYLHRLPSIVHSFAVYKNKEIIGVCTFGIPPSRALCIGICGEEFAPEVIELNRFFLIHNEKNLASFFLSKCLKMLPKPRIVVSYADTGSNHHGYIYQACNFIYTGLSAKRTDADTGGGHGRTNWKPNQKQIERSRKHRYLYFCADKKDKKFRLNKLLYEQCNYPKGDNKNYIVDFIPPTQPLLL